jgi:hypothetical protein
MAVGRFLTMRHAFPATFEWGTIVTPQPTPVGGTCALAADHNSASPLARVGARHLYLPIDWTSLIDPVDLTVQPTAITILHEQIDALQAAGYTISGILNLAGLPPVLAANHDWAARTTAWRCADAITVICDLLSGSVKTWVARGLQPLVEYSNTVLPTVSRGAFIASHHRLLAWGLVTAQLRRAHPDLTLGTYLELSPWALAASTALIAASTQLLDRWLLDALDGRGYPLTPQVHANKLLSQTSAESWLQPDDQRLIAARPDFVVVSIAATADGVAPHALRDRLAWLHFGYQPRRIVVCEPVSLARAPQLHPKSQAHAWISARTADLAAIQQAISIGVPVRGFIARLGYDGDQLEADDPRVVWYRTVTRSHRLVIEP